ncbi:hypothetical protein SDC9_149645 [bioreactor metagenome]|uniref:Uncharacterized protein n=1 Tax=bioreactor metagenome TaxID=1076179 RepID=A0A645EMT0_9ZZZZ
MFSGMLFVAVALCAGGLAIAGLAALLGRASRGTGSTGGSSRIDALALLRRAFLHLRGHMVFAQIAAVRPCRLAYRLCGGWFAVLHRILPPFRPLNRLIWTLVPLRGRLSAWDTRQRTQRPSTGIIATSIQTAGRPCV